MNGGRLNLFQRTMLRWDALHPYGAVHVVRIAGPLDAPRMRQAIRAQLERWGLTGLEVDEARARFIYAGGASQAELRVASAGADEGEALRAEIERELNAPFDATPRRVPFRFFALPVREGFHLGVSYDHFVAGGDCIALLLQGIARRYAGAPESSTPPPDLYPPTYRRLLLRHVVALGRCLVAMPGVIAATRRCARPRYTPDSDGHNAVAYFRIDPPRFAALRGTARSWGVNLNDMMLACLMHALSPLAASRHGAKHRRELAVASIVNLRRDFGVPPPTAWGQFLSSMRVQHPVAAGTKLPDLAAEVHRQTARTRHGKRYFLALLGLGVAEVAWPRLALLQRQRFFAKGHPLWGGVTPLYVDPLWTEPGPAERPAEYLRVVSTGPLSPLVLALTTLGEAAWVGVSFRTAAIPRDRAERLVADLRQCLENPESCVTS